MSYNRASSSQSVLLIADHKWRDLPGLALLKVLLEDRHNIPARIVHYQFWAAALMAFRPAVVCLPTVTGPREQAIARIVRQMGASAVVIPSEGIPVDREILPIVSCTHVDVSNVDIWLGWSEHVRQFQLANGPLKPEQIITTGVNRFDFYVQPYRGLLLPPAELRRRYGLPEDRPIVTWATNYGHAGYARTGSERYIEDDWKVRGLTSLPHYSNPREYARADARAMEVAHDTMLAVFKRLPDVSFIVKMHPAERLDIYLDYLERCRREGANNVVLVNREYIGDVLNASSVHLHRYCTTGLEAWMMGVPTLNLHSDNWHLDPSSGGSSGEAALHDELVITADEIVPAIQRYLQGGRLTAAQEAGRRAHLERWLYRVDGHSAVRQAEILARAVQARRGHRVRWQPWVFGSSTRGMVRGLAHMALNAVAGRPLDQPLTGPQGLEINALGYLDRVTRQPDVERWCAKLRPVVTASGTHQVADPSTVHTA